MLETGEYCQVIADGGMRNGGDVAKAIALRRRRRDDRLAARARLEAPGRGFHWGMATFHPTLPRGARVQTHAERDARGDPRRARRTRTTARFNLFGGLRTSMATCGYKDIAEFNRAELMIAPALQTEGKQLQRDQGVGMGSQREGAPPLVND